MANLVQILEDVANWADRRCVDYSIFRDGAEWTVQLSFSDTNGTFLEFFALPESNTGMLERQLDNLCHKARKARMKTVAYGKAARA